MSGKGYRKSRASYPDGVIGIYDNNGLTIDRYTVVYEPWELLPERTQYFPTTSMSGSPFHPQGVCMHDSLRWRVVGSGWGNNNSVGKAINFEDLPSDCQRAVRQDLEPEEVPV